uniref:Uncharacterized protein n=1 Tax=Cacopsylla melanoneura TaxID=428564 RepID=A0A8D8XGM2_9HEMI
MGSNVVRLTDRNYMLSLRKKIQQEYEDSVRKRIQSREQAEIDRQKKLILDGKMSFSEAPPELTNHPVFKITQITHQMLDDKKKKSKRRKVTPSSSANPSSRSAGSDSQQSLSSEPATTHPPSNRLSVGGSSEKRSRRNSGEGVTKLDATPTETSSDSARDSGGGLMEDTGGTLLEFEPEFKFTQEQFDKLRYETESVKILRGLETVDEIYEMANRIIGELTLHNKEEPPEEPRCTTLYIKDEKPSVL